jgi:hypothetical protein
MEQHYCLIRGQAKAFHSGLPVQPPYEQASLDGDLGADASNRVAAGVAEL